MVYESKQKQTSKHSDLASTGKNLQPLFPLTVQDKHTICKFSRLSPLSNYKTTLKQQLNDEKWCKVRWKAKSLVCFWFNYVVFPPSAWKNCVFVLINSILRNLYVFESCFRILAVILVSDFKKILYKTSHWCQWAACTCDSQQQWWRVPWPHSVPPPLRQLSAHWPGCRPEQHQWPGPGAPPVNQQQVSQSAG